MCVYASIKTHRITDASFLLYITFDDFPLGCCFCHRFLFVRLNPFIMCVDNNIYLQIGLEMVNVHFVPTNWNMMRKHCVAQFPCYYCLEIQMHAENFVWNSVSHILYVWMVAERKFSAHMCVLEKERHWNENQFSIIFACSLLLFSPNSHCMVTLNSTYSIQKKIIPFHHYRSFFRAKRLCPHSGSSAIQYAFQYGNQSNIFSWIFTTTYINIGKENTKSQAHSVYSLSLEPANFYWIDCVNAIMMISVQFSQKTNTYFFLHIQM